MYIGNIGIFNIIIGRHRGTIEKRTLFCNKKRKKNQNKMPQNVHVYKLIDNDFVMCDKIGFI